MRITFTIKSTHHSNKNLLRKFGSVTEMLQEFYKEGVEFGRQLKHDSTKYVEKPQHLIHNMDVTMEITVKE